MKNDTPDNGGPADGMNLRQYVAIMLRVPDSGTPWLDEMIRASIDDDFAKAALQRLLAISGSWQHEEILANASHDLPPRLAELVKTKRGSEVDWVLGLLNISVNEMKLSVRPANMLANANISTIGELVIRTEMDLLCYRNFGKVSLQEINDKLAGVGLWLGMKLPVGADEGGA
jgi:DNA-directed RNA polymerase alpha subunit